LDFGPDSTLVVFIVFHKNSSDQTNRLIDVVVSMLVLCVVMVPLTMV